MIFFEELLTVRVDFRPF